MQVLNQSFDITKFYEQLSRSSGRVLMLDYDGTLAPFRPERDQATPYPELLPVLGELVASERTRTVIISGRSIEHLKNLLTIERFPELWGSHGLERLTADGHYHIAHLGATIQNGIRTIGQWIKRSRLDKYVETKPGGFAFHWRGLSEDEAERVRSTVLSAWASNPHHFHLVLKEFDGGLEIRAGHISKANAVKEIITESPEDAMVAYCGDDYTDEDAFRALGDHGLKVLVREEPRETGADIVLKPPEELLHFLEAWI